MTNLDERFWSKVDRGDGSGCWMWTRARVRGYGQFYLNGDVKRLAQAHRVSYADAHGLALADVPLLDHRCHNADPACAGGESCPHRACVRPDHLAPSSHRENLLASPLTLAAQNAAKTHCPKNHPYDAANTHITKGGLRQCRTCSRDRARARRAAGNR